MKVGILTYHNAYNYGAVLQCYALQEYIKSMGHEVEVIDYRNEWVEGIYKPLSVCVVRRYLNRPKALAGYIKAIGKRWQKWIRKKKQYGEFVHAYLNLSHRVRKICPSDYDVIIIGSDQMWGLSCLGGVFDEVYLGKFESYGTRLIGYAISTDFNSMNLLSERGQLKDIMNRFHMISFRESVYASLARKCTNMDVCTCVDPTLLLQPSGWEKLLNDKWKSRKYVAIYQVRKRIGNEEYIYELAKKCACSIGKGCEVVDLDPGYSVEDFVSAIKNAQIVITSSFHATAFSVIFGTRFYSVKLDDGYDDRYVNLLQKLGLESRLLDLSCAMIDYRTPLPKFSMSDAIKPSVEFLNKALS